MEKKQRRFTFLNRRAPGSNHFVPRTLGTPIELLTPEQVDAEIRLHFRNLQMSGKIPVYVPDENATLPLRKHVFKPKQFIHRG